MTGLLKLLIVGCCTGAMTAAYCGQSINAQEEAPQLAGKIHFARDIRPILADTCFNCHGPDEETRETDLRLDQYSSLLDAGILVPGDVEASELFRRLVAKDARTKMPPPDFHKKLTDEQIQMFRQWIEQGATWSEHWSFVSPIRPPIPEVNQVGWPQNPIDYFVLAHNESLKLLQNPPADKAALLRRVYLDLIGLPPSPEEISAFMQDDQVDAFERVVDRMLSSPRYGEHQARFWLDAARYGDTHGLHLDNYREMWLYRDWVIDAFNRNLPYDQFLIEQLAGDLLEAPTVDQLVATGFHRAHVTTSEGGVIDEEVYVRNTADRVATTGIVFMGLSLECAACHDHKYDPINMREYYQLFAFFNSIDGPPLDGNAKVHEPSLAKPSEQQSQRLEQLESELLAARQAIEVELAKIEYSEPIMAEVAETQIESGPKSFVWLDDKLPLGAKPQGNWSFVDAEAGPVYSGARSHKGAAVGFHQHFFEGADKPLKIAAGDKLFCYVYLDSQDVPQQIMLQFNDGTWDHRVYWGSNIINFGEDGTPSRWRVGDLPPPGEWVRLEIPVESVNLQPGAMVHGWAFSQSGGTVYWDYAGIETSINQEEHYRSFAGWLADQRLQKGRGLPQPLAEWLSQEDFQLDDERNAKLLNHFLQFVFVDTREVFKPMQQTIESLTREQERIRTEIPTTLIYREMAEPKQAYVLLRGEYDQRGEPVERGVPAFLPPLDADLPLDRLGLAKWLVSGRHPLTARVQVNRLWQQLFGIGIVETQEDFGGQGAWPSHPELLDWLAVEFMEAGWDIKHLLKLMVMSATYQQAAHMTPDKLKRDPRNRNWARGPRVRLDAEVLRDQALAVSGLLVETIGGPSVKPPQPAGLWEAVGYSASNTVKFTKDVGRDKVHRRSLYTFWKRTAPPPQMMLMDAPSRESCTVRRERTNTPLQALMLMNDPQYVEAARYLAQLALQNRSSDTERIEWMFLRALGREPNAQERMIFAEYLSATSQRFMADEAAAQALLAIGEEPAQKVGPAATELAAWTMVASLLMNMDEFVTKP
ncbi:MAG TPA: PSD1 and planctomycete cytochrome C domain-containing protein [Pirellulaceae bacterium]|nr:PSD1 and planctomycete cytochrome C domain-containing protein [Pirellulaceae bacterium]